MELEVGDIVMCTVERIAGTVVFVKIDGDGEGSIILSEIAPGRIRNLREYVVPKKRIICKVIRISGERIDLSLRRVTKKEQKEITEQQKLEKSCKSILKTVLKEQAEKIIEEIQKQDKLHSFLQDSKENQQKLEKITGKENAKKILEILNTQKKKEFTIKRTFLLHNNSSEGLKILKKIFEETKDTEIKYLAAGKYAIKATAENPKEADRVIKETLEKIENQAKKSGSEFSIKEK